MDPSLRTIIYQLKREWRLVLPSVRKIAGSLFIGLFTTLLFAKGYSETVESSLLRGWFWLRGPRAVPTSVSIVRLDKPAYAKINLSPGELWPRQYMAEGVKKIAEAGAKLIIIDGVPARPSDDPKYDRMLAEVFEKTPTVIARGSELVIDSDVHGNKIKTRVQHQPIDLLAESAKAVVQMEVRLRSGRVQEISLSNREHVFSKDNVPILSPLREFYSAKLVEPGGDDFINFYGGPATIPSISFARLIGDEKVPTEYFKNRVVFIGALSDSGSGVEAGKDSFLTSVSNEWMFGVEIHANIAANLIDSTYLRRLPESREGMLVSLLALVGAFFVLSLGMLSGAVLALFFTVVWLAFSYYSFLSLFYFVPAFTLAIVFAFLVIIRWGLALAFGGK